MAVILTNTYHKNPAYAFALNCMEQTCIALWLCLWDLIFVFLTGAVQQCQPAVLPGSTVHWSPTAHHLAREGSVCAVASDTPAPAAAILGSLAGQVCWWPLPSAVSVALDWEAKLFQNVKIFSHISILFILNRF